MQTSARTRKSGESRPVPINPKLLATFIERLKADPDLLEGLRQSVSQGQAADDLSLLSERGA